LDGNDVVGSGLFTYSRWFSPLGQLARCIMVYKWPCCTSLCILHL